ncbi:hypothetical protein A3Q56_06625 [Intoshia linei]|uniref:BRCT domain-containing protein n=1 Tax=Intoshia linei TaxID=1819745 RepID=A0A177AUF8_9BILA|nr:hypothetical protein A3Q56_06625 [Intoshia linei]
MDEIKPDIFSINKLVLNLQTVVDKIKLQIASTPKNTDTFDKTELTKNLSTYNIVEKRNELQILEKKPIQNIKNYRISLSYTFVATGIFESYDRKTLENIIVAYGGEHGTYISEDTSYVLLGRDAGPKKLQLIDRNGIETLNEDQFVKLIKG